MKISTLYCLFAGLCLLNGPDVFAAEANPEPPPVANRIDQYAQMLSFLDLHIGSNAQVAQRYEPNNAAVCSPH